MYDPFKHAASLGLAVRHVPHLETVGLYTDNHIYLREGLNRRTERCVLAHEISHAVHGDEPTKDPALYARRELRADREAAQWLIPDHALADCAAVTEDIGQWALELDVTGWILEARLKELDGTRSGPLAHRP